MAVGSRASLFHVARAVFSAGKCTFGTGYEYLKYRL